jgi:hypothetical protein
MQPPSIIDFSKEEGVIPPLDASTSSSQGTSDGNAGIENSFSNSSWRCPALIDSLLSACDTIPGGEMEVRQVVEAAALQGPEVLLVAFGHAQRLADAPKVRHHRLVEVMFMKLGPTLVLKPVNRVLAQQALRAIANHHLGTFVMLLEIVHAMDPSSTSMILNIVQVWAARVRVMFVNSHLR